MWYIYIYTHTHTHTHKHTLRNGIGFMVSSLTSGQPNSFSAVVWTLCEPSAESGALHHQLGKTGSWGRLDGNDECAQIRANSQFWTPRQVPCQLHLRPWVGLGFPSDCNCHPTPSSWEHLPFCPSGLEVIPKKDGFTKEKKNYQKSLKWNSHRSSGHPKICHFVILIILSWRQLKTSKGGERLSPNSSYLPKTDPPKGIQLS